jgi:hypothetical protein
VRHPEGTRFERRLRARRLAEAVAAAEEGTTPPPPPPTVVDRRRTDRRTQTMTPAEVDDWLRRNGITGGDRRKAERRRR